MNQLNKILPIKSPTKLSDLLKPNRNVYCVNCGEKGHVIKECDRPITSFGIIAFKIVNNELEEQNDLTNNDLTNNDLTNHELNSEISLKKILENLPNPLCQSSILEPFGLDELAKTGSNYPKIKFLMIQRKDTMGYIDFLRGKYTVDKIYICLNEMTFYEKQCLLTYSFDELWEKLWVSKSKCYKNEYEIAKQKYEKLNIKELVDNSITKYSYTEFSFPKGRRNMREQNFGCAQREFYEESGFNKNTYDLIENYPIIKEDFIGTNEISYRHYYYLVKMKDNFSSPKIDYSNDIQMGEVKNIGWFDLNQCLALIRPYDTEKKKVITNVFNDISKMYFNQKNKQESLSKYYSNTLDYLIDSNLF